MTKSQGNIVKVTPSVSGYNLADYNPVSSKAISGTPLMVSFSIKVRVSVTVRVRIKVRISTRFRVWIKFRINV